MSGYIISVRESGSSEKVFAVQFVLDTCRQLMESVLSLWSLHGTLAQATRYPVNFMYLLIGSGLTSW